LLIVPTICHVLINGLDAHPKHVLSCDIVDDQFLDRSCVIFPGSRGRRFPGSCVDKSRDTQVAKGSRDELHVGSCDMFPWSRDAEVTDLLLRLGGASTARDRELEGEFGTGGNSGRPGDDGG